MVLFRWCQIRQHLLSPPRCLQKPCWSRKLWHLLQHNLDRCEKRDNIGPSVLTMKNSFLGTIKGASRSTDKKKTLRRTPTTGKRAVAKARRAERQRPAMHLRLWDKPCGTAPRLRDTTSIQLNRVHVRSRSATLHNLDMARFCFHFYDHAAACDDARLFQILQGPW